MLHRIPKIATSIPLILLLFCKIRYITLEIRMYITTAASSVMILHIPYNIRFGTSLIYLPVEYCNLNCIQTFKNYISILNSGGLFMCKKNKKQIIYRQKKLKTRLNYKIFNKITFLLMKQGTIYSCKELERDKKQ